MISNTDLPHQADISPHIKFLKPRKLLALIVAILLIVLVAGTGGYWLGINTVQKTSQDTVSQTSISSTPMLQLQQNPVSPDTVLQTYYNWYLSCARATQHPARLHGFDRDSAAHHRAAGEFVVASTTVH
jgi:hypothetical protein